MDHESMNPRWRFRAPRRACTNSLKPIKHQKNLFPAKPSAPACYDEGTSNIRVRTIAKNRNTYAKRQREAEKRQRADDKRTKQQFKKLKSPELPAPRQPIDDPPPLS
jgi:hypothetical protein